MTLRFIDRIWHIRGSVALPPPQGAADAFDRLAPLFQQRGTSTACNDTTLTFTKAGQAPQDKMSIFDSGVLTVIPGVDGPKLHYDLVSRALLFCFLAPLLFLSIAQLTIAISNHQIAAAKAEARAHPEKKKAEKPPLPMNALDKALGAPAPDKPDKKKPPEEKKKLSPTPAYVFAALFALLYLVGRILEDRLIASLFKRRLLGIETPVPAQSEPSATGTNAAY